MKKKLQKNRKKNHGFTFVEAIVVMFIFAMVMSAVAGIFAASVKSQRKTKDTQKNVEDARFVLERISKTLRTSSVLYCDAACDGSSPNNLLVAFDYSQNSCIKYEFDAVGSAIKTGLASVDKSSCGSTTSFTLVPMSEEPISQMEFYAESSDSSTRGKVTIVMTVGNIEKTKLETTVSLRDYGT